MEPLNPGTYKPGRTHPHDNVVMLVLCCFYTIQCTDQLTRSYLPWKRQTSCSILGYPVIVSMKDAVFKTEIKVKKKKNPNNNQKPNSPFMSNGHTTTFLLSAKTQRRVVTRGSDVRPPAYSTRFPTLCPPSSPPDYDGRVSGCGTGRILPAGLHFTVKRHDPTPWSSCKRLFFRRILRTRRTQITSLKY